MNWFENLVNQINNVMWNQNLLVVLLVISGIYFTLRTKGVQFRLFGHMIKLITEKTKANQEGVSSFQAFCISTASRVGVGNLAGVVAAVSVGGPGCCILDVGCSSFKFRDSFYRSNNCTSI